MKNRNRSVHEPRALAWFACIAILVAGALGFAAPTASAEPGPAWSVRWQPVTLVNGAPVVFRVAAPRTVRSLTGNWLGHDVYFSFDTGSKTWIGFAGVSLETKAGIYVLHVTGKTESGKDVSSQEKIVIAKAKYPTIVSVTVSKQFTEPSPEQMQQINQAKTIKQEVFRHFDPERHWSGTFLPPVNERVSDVFGTRRVFNGETKSVHEGMDYAAPKGTPVRALNAGTVLLAQDLYFEGGFVVIDHGQGLMTLYLHLSEFKVKAGDHVDRGQEIALSGDSGRATGPHLHIAVRWEGVYLDPAVMLKLQLPARPVRVDPQVSP